jgi:hypothetical protein
MILGVTWREIVVIAICIAVIVGFVLFFHFVVLPASDIAR